MATTSSARIRSSKLRNLRSTSTSIESLHHGFPKADGRAHPDQVPIMVNSHRSPDRDASEYSLRDLLADLIGVVALIAIVYGALLFPEVTP